MKRYSRWTWAWSLVIAIIFATMNPSASYAQTSMDAFKKQRTYSNGLFADIQGTEWYAKDVASAYELGLLSGRGGNQFDPRGNLTLAEAISIAARIHHIYNGGDGQIAQEAGAPWYAGAVRYALENDMIRDHSFTEWQKNATRSEVAHLLFRSIGYSALNQQKINDVTYIPDVFPDNRYHLEIFSLYNAGVISGTDEYGAFLPNANITRAEMAAMLNRFVHLDERLTFQLKKKPLFTPPSEDVAMAYLQVINELVRNYGIYSSESGEVYGTGLVYANLIDFNGDGVEELYLLYMDYNTGDGAYIEEIWGYKGDAATLIHSEGHSISGIVSDQTTQLTVTDSGSYIIYSGGYSRGIQGVDGYGQWSGTYVNVYSVVDGEWVLVAKGGTDTWYPDDESLPNKYEYTIDDRGHERKVTKEQYDSFIHRYVNENTVMLIDGGYGAPSFEIDLDDSNRMLKQAIESLREATTSKEIANEQDLYASMSLDEKRKLIRFLNQFSFDFPSNYEGEDEELVDVLWFAHNNLQSRLWEEYEYVEFNDSYYVRIKQEPIDQFVERWFGFTPGSLPPYYSEYGERELVLKQNGYYYFLDAAHGYLSTPSYQVEKMLALNNGRYVVEFTFYELIDLWYLDEDVELGDYRNEPKDTWSPLIWQHANIDGVGQAIVKEAVYDGESVWQLQKFRFNQEPLSAEQWQQWIR